MKIGIYLNTTGADHIRTYVYNDNQVSVNTLSWIIFIPKIKTRNHI